MPIDIPLVDIYHPLVELFPDGRVLLADTRCAWRGPDDFDRNGVIYDPRAGAISEILLGDGIASIAVDGLSRIWVSYFDEGVFGNFGWNEPGPAGPGAGGLVCFNVAGDVLWEFNSQVSNNPIDDCYAMNATRDEIWVYYFSAFKVCRVGMDFSRTILTPKDVKGSSAFAVSEAAMLFAQGYEWMSLIDRNGHELGERQKISVALPDGASPHAQFVGRGSTLNVLGEAGWFSMDITRL